VTPLLPTPLLTLFCLLAATLLGAGIGACLWHLRLVSRHVRTLRELREDAERERQRTAREQARAEQAIVRHDALAAHAREQERRLGSLEAELLDLKGRSTRTQRDLAGERTGRARGAERPRPSAVLLSDDHLPVLKRRVGRAEHAARSPADTALGPPEPAESRLSEAAEEPELDLLDTRKLFGDADG